MLNHTDLKIFYLNARSLHKHIDDVQKVIQYSSVDVQIFTEKRFSAQDPNEMYAIQGYELYKNDDISHNNRPYHGTAVYFKLPMMTGYP